MDTCINDSWIFCSAAHSLGIQHVILPENTFRIWHRELCFIYVNVVALFGVKENAIWTVILLYKYLSFGYLVQLGGCSRRSYASSKV